jgi:thiamine biosynthesis protein ThiS
MRIRINNREEELEGDSITVAQMLDIKKFTFRMRIVKINGVLIHRDMYATAIIYDGDDVQMLYLMSGG